MNDVLKDAQRISVFRGDESYALSSFLREVDTLFLLVDSQPDAKAYIYQRIILNKLQGDALHVVRTLGQNPTWEKTKEALVNNFGIKESYHQLYQKAFSANNDNGINIYYNKLLSILCKINEKYENDSEKPLEFSPAYAEKIILKTFLNNIDINLASVIINRNISNLRDAYGLLEKEGLIRESNEVKINPSMYKGAIRKNFNYQSNANVQNSNSNPNVARNSSNFNSNSNNTVSRSEMQNTRFQARRYSGSNNFRNDRGSNQTRTIGQNENFQMEIDHIQENDESDENIEEVNFHTTASIRHFH